MKLDIEENHVSYQNDYDTLKHIDDELTLPKLSQYRRVSYKKPQQNCNSDDLQWIKVSYQKTLPIYEFKYSKEANGWIIYKENFVFSPEFNMKFIRIQNSPVFSDVRTAEKWLEKYYESRKSYVYFIV